MKTPKCIQEWSKILTAKKDGTILISFGSMAPAHAMPVNWKLSILGLAAKYPNYQFIWKYEKDDLKSGKSRSRYFCWTFKLWIYAVVYIALAFLSLLTIFTKTFIFLKCLACLFV